MSTNSNCLCSKKRLNLNDTNWRRHLTSCSIAKSKKSNVVNDVSSFFTKKLKIYEEQDSPKKGNCKLLIMTSKLSQLLIYIRLLCFFFNKKVI